MIAELDKDEDNCDYYELSLADVRNSDISKWYKEFQAATIPTVIFPIPSDMTEYLKDSYLLHHEEWSAPEWVLDESDNSFLDLEDDWYADDVSNNEPEPEPTHSTAEQDCDEYEPPASQRTELSETAIKLYNEKINDYIKDLGGSVLPKVNWVAPKDAQWVGLNKSLKCYTPSEVFLLLKTSTEILDLVTDGFKKYRVSSPDQAPVEFNLVLRKWMDTLSTDMEFRCFVCDERLTAICQRDIEVGYSTISSQRDSIIKDVHDFFRDTIYGRYPSNFYVFDVARLSPGRVLLVDFGVFGLPTDPLLFTYRELKMLMDEIDSNLKSKSKDSKSQSGLKDVHIYGEPYFRYLTDNFSVRPLQRNTISPADITTYLREAAGVD